MSPKNHKSHFTYFVLLLMTSFILSACMGQVYSQELETDEIQIDPLPTEATAIEVEKTEIEYEPLSVVTHEEALNLVIAYLLEKYPLEIPHEWLIHDQTPDNLVGSSNFLYTSGAWVAQISAPVVALQYLVYSIEIDHIASGLRWIGEVDASGAINEIVLSEPLKILSVEDARDAAVDFIVAKYQWTNLEGWIENGQEPIENAGIRHTFTAGPWVVQVEFFAAAPIVPEYRIVADHLNKVAHWSGTVKASGEVVEEVYSEK